MSATVTEPDLLAELSEANARYQAAKVAAPERIKRLVEKEVRELEQARNIAAAKAHAAEHSLRSITAAIGRKNVDAAKKAIQNGQNQ